MSRYIDADEAIRQILNFYTNAERMKMFNFTPNVIKQTVADIISDIPTAEVKPMKWISVKDKLPKEGVDVLVYLESGEYLIRHIVEVFGYKEWSGGKIGERTHNVIAWQPLPTPYKSESEDKE